MITLGIETSCDETALAIIETKQSGTKTECRVLSSLIHSQAELHSAYGGVFPALAKREHGKNLVPLLHKLLLEAAPYMTTTKNICDDSFESFLAELNTIVAPQNPELYESFTSAEFVKNIPNIDRIAVTQGPGLEPALWVGITFAKILSDLWSIPVIPVDHMEGHIIGSLIRSDIANGVWHEILDVQFPCLALLISGGHTEIVQVDNIGKYKILGRTLDDAVGEAYDKVARLLGLQYPGGPHLSLLADEARKFGISIETKLPRPMISSDNLDFSFSGLKTAVLYAVRSAPRAENGELDRDWKLGLAREFEDAVSDTLRTKLKKAVEQTSATSLIIGGGVSANSYLRRMFEEVSKEFSLRLFLPSKHVSGDNALMIALAGSFMTMQSQNTPIKAQGTKSLSQIF